MEQRLDIRQSNSRATSAVNYARNSIRRRAALAIYNASAFTLSTFILFSFSLPVGSSSYFRLIPRLNRSVLRSPTEEQDNGGNTYSRKAKMCGVVPRRGVQWSTRLRRRVVWGMRIGAFASYCIFLWFPGGEVASAARSLVSKLGGGRRTEEGRWIQPQRVSSRSMIYFIAFREASIIPPPRYWRLFTPFPPCSVCRRTDWTDRGPQQRINRYRTASIPGPRQNIEQPFVPWCMRYKDTVHDISNARLPFKILAAEVKRYTWPAPNSSWKRETEVRTASFN